MDIADLQKKIEDYENKMREYETKRVASERKITRLEGDLSEKEEEIRRAKFSLLWAHPALINPDIDPLNAVQRMSGYLDPSIVTAACLDACSDVNNPAKRERAETEATVLHEEWQEKVRDANWRLYVTGPGEGQGEVITVESEDILNLKKRYGDKLYLTIKNAWLDFQETQRTGVNMKAWNYDAGREKSLSELLDHLLQLQLQPPNNLPNNIFDLEEEDDNLLEED